MRVMFAGLLLTPEYAVPEPVTLPTVVLYVTAEVVAGLSKYINETAPKTELEAP